MAVQTPDHQRYLECFCCIMEDVWTRPPSSVKVFYVAPCRPSGVRNYLKEALVNIITVHAEVESPNSSSDLISANLAFTGWFLSPLRSSQSLRTWSPGSCPRSSSQLQMRCVVLCSVCLPSARMEPCRYLQWDTHKQNSLALLVRPWLISGPSHSSREFTVVFPSCWQLKILVI